MSLRGSASDRSNLFHGSDCFVGQSKPWPSRSDTRFRKLPNDRQGFSTLEILIASAIFVLTVASVLEIVYSSQKIIIDAQLNQEALRKAQSFLETARAASETDFNLLNPIAASADSDPAFQKSLDVSMADPWTKLVKSTVSWQEEGSLSASVTLATLISNPGGFSNGNSCNSVLANPAGWKNPKAYQWDFGQLGLNNGDGTGFGISNLAVFNQKLYITLNAAPANLKDSFYIFNLPADASQPPSYIGSVDNSSTTAAALSAVAVAGNYAYLANGYGANFSNCAAAQNCAQLQIVDISNPARPTVITNFKVPGVTGSGGQAVGSSIYYKDGYIYLGLAATASGPEFNIIDVGGGSGSPVNPVWRGAYAVGNGINSIAVKGNYAYLATAANENFTIVDISNPASPRRASGYTPAALPGSNGVGSNHGESVFNVGSRAYLGRTYGTTEFYVLDASSPATTTIIASKDIGSGNQTSIYGLAVRDYLAFILTKASFQVWNISSPASMQPWTSDGTTGKFLALSALGGSGTAMYCYADDFYIAIDGATKDLISVLTPGP